MQTLITILPLTKEKKLGRKWTDQT